MGVRGAALATVISQIIAVIWQFIIFCNPNEIIHFKRGIWRLDREITLRSFAIGTSPFLMNIAHCLVVVIINRQLVRFGGDMALAAYGIINRFTFVFAMIVMGLNQGMQPIVGYNYGAKQYKRMLRAFELTAICASVVMGLVFILGECVPVWMTRIFTHDKTLIEATLIPMRILCCSMWLVGFQMVTGNFFTSIGMAGKAIFLSLTRQVLYLIPLTLLLPAVFADPLAGVWWSLPISDLAASILTLWMLLKQRKEFKMKLKEKESQTVQIQS